MRKKKVVKLVEKIEKTIDDTMQGWLDDDIKHDLKKLKKEIDIDLFNDHIMPVAKLIEAWDHPEKMNINEWNYFEMMDRLSIIMSNLDHNCIEHPVTKELPEVEEKLEQAIGLLYEAYQLMGEKLASK